MIVQVVPIVWIVLTARLVSKQMNKIVKDQKNHDGNLFKRAKVKEFIARVDDKCCAGLESFCLVRKLF